MYFQFSVTSFLNFILPVAYDSIPNSTIEMHDLENMGAVTEISSQS